MLTTATKGIPYPEDDDPVAAYPAITQALAQQVETLLGVIPARFEIGKTDVTVTASTLGNASITFTPGRFTAQPVLVAMTIASSVWMAYAPTTPTATGGSIGVRQIQGTSTTATVRVHWIAVQF